MARATPLPPDERRAAIIAATVPLLRERGREISTREIAEAAGIAEGTIFRVFSSKEELIDAVIDDALDPHQSFRELGAIDRSLDLETRVCEVAAIIQERVRRVFGLMYAVGFRQPPESESRRVRRPIDHRYEVDSVAAVLQPDADRLRIGPRQAATMLNGLVLALTHPLMRGACDDAGALDPHQIAEIFLHGILAPTDAEGN